MSAAPATGLLAIPRSRETLAVAGASIAITLLIGGVLAHERAGVASPFEIPVFRHLILYQDYYVIAPFIAVLLAALLAPVRAFSLRLASFCGRHVWTVATVTSAMLALGTHLVYHVHPLSLDEYAVIFQSKIFAAGKLTGQFPPDLIDWLIPNFFQGRFIKPSYESGAVLSIYWPGFSFLLTPFTAIGVPWLLNPLLGGATLVIMHRLGLVLLGDMEKAGYVVLLTLASPAITVNAISYYSMPAHLVANGLFALLLLNPTPLRSLAAGLLGSLALVLHNPAPHALFALPWIVWLALRADRWKVLVFLAAGYLPVSVVVGLGWPIFVERMGASFAAPLAAPGEAAGILARVVNRVLGWTSSTGTSSHMLDLAKLWLWAVPGLLTAAGIGAWLRRKEGGVWITLAASAFLTYFGYFLVSFDQGHGWGFRYFHSAWLVIPLFAASALTRRFDAEVSTHDRPASSSPLAGYLMACATLSLAVLTSFRALQVEHYMERHLAQRPGPLPEEGRKIVFINMNYGYYSWDLIQNDPYLRGRVITFRTRNTAADRTMMAVKFPQYRLLRSDERGSVWDTGQR